MSNPQLISNEYKELNENLHRKSPEYGNQNTYLSENLPQTIKILSKMYGFSSVLDYGCGKGKIVDSLRKKFQGNHIQINGYDPCVEEYSRPAKAADILISTDVLEHIEPDAIDNVLDHISDLTEHICFLIIDLMPAVKTLSDGRNAHILLKPNGWWLDKLSDQYFFGTYYIDQAPANAKKKTMAKKKLCFVGAKTQKDILPAMNLFSLTSIGKPPGKK